MAEGGPVRAQPQVVGGEEVWPEHWGLARAQVGELLEHLRSDPSWRSENTVYDLVSDFVVPWTRGTGVGYALLVNPTPQEVNVMVSHAWGENAEDFLEAVLRATGERDVVYICALANYQAEDGAGPSIQQQLGSDPAESPFRRVLQHIRSCGAKAGWSWWARPWLLRLPAALLCAGVVLLCGLLSSRPSWSPEMGTWHGWSLLWSTGVCAVAALLHAWLLQRAPIYPGRMVVVPNRQGDIYSRLWCVYEIFIARTLRLRVDLAPTFAIAGRVSSRSASCGSQDDFKRIRGEIESSHFGYEDIDRTVRRVARSVRWHTLGVLVKYTILFVAPKTVGPNQIGNLLVPYLAFYMALISGAYCAARKTQGIVRASGWAICASIAVVILRTAFLAWETRFSLGMSRLSLEASFFVDILLIEAAAVAVLFLGACCNPCPACLSARSRSAALVCMYALGVLGNSILFYVVCSSSLVPMSMTDVLLDACWFSYSYIFPVYMWWTESVQWGVRVSCTTGWPRCARAGASAALLVWAAEAFLSLDLGLRFLVDYNHYYGLPAA